jgi:hypothetical protein
VPEPPRDVACDFSAADRQRFHERQHQDDDARGEDRKQKVSRPTDSLETSRWASDYAGSVAAPFIAALIIAAGSVGLVYAGHAAIGTVKSGPSIDLVIAETLAKRRQIRSSPSSAFAIFFDLYPGEGVRNQSSRTRPRRHGYQRSISGGVLILPVWAVRI